jgi:hypothetical protein
MSKKFLSLSPDRQQIVAGAIVQVIDYLETRGVTVSEENAWPLADVLSVLVEPDLK